MDLEPVLSLFGFVVESGEWEDLIVFLMPLQGSVPHLSHHSYYASISPIGRPSWF